LLLFQYSFMGLCRFPKPTYKSLQTLILLWSCYFTMKLISTYKVWSKSSVNDQIPISSLIPFKVLPSGIHLFQHSWHWWKYFWKSSFWNHCRWCVMWKLCLQLCQIASLSSFLWTWGNSHKSHSNRSGE
jgi:hypothetical protein